MKTLLKIDMSEDNEITVYQKCSEIEFAYAMAGLFEGKQAFKLEKMIPAMFLGKRVSNISSKKLEQLFSLSEQTIRMMNDIVGGSDD